MNFRSKNIMEKVKKANSITGMIKRSFSHFSPASFRCLFTSFVRPHLMYTQAVWSLKLQKHSNLIESVQCRATKTVDSCKNLPYSKRLKNIGLVTLQQRRSMNDMVEIYKHLHHYDNSVIPNRFHKRKKMHLLELRSFSGSRKLIFNKFPMFELV